MDYDLSLFPPAPRLEIRLIALPRNSIYGPVSAFVDTGADATIVPMDNYSTDARLRSHPQNYTRLHRGKAHRAHLPCGHRDRCIDIARH